VCSSDLDKHIVGQDAAKRAVAIALRNRWRRQQVPEPLRQEITPKNILMIGPTGVGKTEIARRLAKLAHSPFLKVEASKYTEVGYVGRDVESMVRDLVEIAVNMVRDEQRVDVRELPGVIGVVGLGLAGGMPVMELGRGDQPSQRTERHSYVRMDEDRLQRHQQDERTHTDSTEAQRVHEHTECEQPVDDRGYAGQVGDVDLDDVRDPVLRRVLLEVHTGRDPERDGRQRRNDHHEHGPDPRREDAGLGWLAGRKVGEELRRESLPSGPHHAEEKGSECEPA